MRAGLAGWTGRVLASALREGPGWGSGTPAAGREVWGGGKGQCQPHTVAKERAAGRVRSPEERGARRSQERERDGLKGHL